MGRYGGVTFAMKSLVTVLYRPYATFCHLRDKRDRMAPLWTLIAMSLAAAILLLPTILQESTDAMKHAIATGKLSLLHYDEAWFRSVTVFTVLGATIVVVLFQVYVGAWLLMLVNRLVSGEATYSDLVNVTLYSSVPGTVGKLVIGLVAFLMKADTTQQVMLDAARLFRPESPFLQDFLSYFDPFSLWSMFLVIVGLHMMSKKPIPIVGAWVVAGWIGIVLANTWLDHLGG